MGSGARLSGSEALYQRALEVLPGGVNSPVRAMRSIGRDPIFVERGAGPHLWDADGNRYVDWVCSWGPLILGHADPDVVAAAQEAVARGSSYGAPTEGEVELAEEICARVPSVEMARMTSSGTEASMSAVRLARAATGRERIVKFAGAYHGHVDGLLAEAGSGLATAGVPASPGITEAQAAATMVVPWNDLAAIETAVSEARPAAIIAEPIPANMGLVPPRTGFLERLRELADQSGALLILDEVISGFRVAPGGAQELLGVEADLTVMGKVIGGGLPAAAYGGRRELMERVAPAGDVYQAGTLAGNPVAVAAARATLRKLDSTAYQRLAAITTELGHGIQRAAGDRPVTVVFGGPVEPWPPATVFPGLLSVFFAERAPRDFAEAAACDTDAYARFCRALLERGIYPPASQFEAWFPSLAHGPEEIERTIGACAEAFGDALG